MLGYKIMSPVLVGMSRKYVLTPDRQRVTNRITALTNLILEVKSRVKTNLPVLPANVMLTSNG